MNREFLMLAHSYEPKHHVGGYFMSEKLDGRRMYWDGGITRGMAKAVIPWANTDKDSRLHAEQISTGLWSRYGNVIHAPDWWLNCLPRIPLDGEAYSGALRQDLMSITASHTPDIRWQQVQYFCFDMPAYERVFMDGRINNPNFKKVFQGIMGWINAAGLLVAGGLDYRPEIDTQFETTYFLLKKWLTGATAIAHTQVQLPYQTDVAIQMLEDETARIVACGGEGMIVRAPGGLWVPKRVRTVLKVKPLKDAEGVVTGYTAGCGKHLGRMGALILDYQGKRLELSGFCDQERRLITSQLVKCSDPTGKAQEWAIEHPGEDVPEWIESAQFLRGTMVTFKYRGMSKDGIPQEARYWRKRYEN